jgi:protein arginine kinase activator
MKCQHCEKPATFHITELTDPDGPSVLHLCEEHARTYLAQGTQTPSSSALAGMLAKQLQLEQTAEELAQLDQKQCPMCGITFAEFRQSGRFGCPYDYVCFEENLEPLLINIHGAKQHVGKRPSRQGGSPDHQHQIIQLRRDMKSAVEKEDYERASKIRDEIKKLELDINTESDPNRSSDITDV